MIYLNEEKINKIGGVNRAYLNGRLCYQAYVGGTVNTEWRASDTEFIYEIVDGVPHFYMKEYEWYISGNIERPTSNYRKGEEVTYEVATIDGYICDSGNKYAKNEYIVNLSTPINSGIFIQGDLIEENAEDCAFVEDFIMNYNFNDYDEATGTVPNRDGASWDYDLQLYGVKDVQTDGKNKYLNVTNSDTYSWYKFASGEDNVFNQGIEENGMTFICKVDGGSGADLFSNRWADGYSYMIRPYENYFTIHTAAGEVKKIGTSTTGPTVYAVTIGSNGITYYNLTEDTNLRTSLGAYVTTGNTGVFFFGSNFVYETFNEGDPISEQWSGKCYWMFCINRKLSLDEIKKVANDNGM